MRVNIKILFMKQKLIEVKIDADGYSGLFDVGGVITTIILQKIRISKVICGFYYFNNA